MAAKNARFFLSRETAEFSNAFGSIKRSSDAQLGKSDSTHLQAFFKHIQKWEHSGQFARAAYWLNRTANAVMYSAPEFSIELEARLVSLQAKLDPDEQARLFKQADFIRRSETRFNQFMKTEPVADLSGMRGLNDYVIKNTDASMAHLLFAIAELSEKMCSQFPRYLYKENGGTNKYGETVMNQDDGANRMLINVLFGTGLVSKVYSEELATPLDSGRNGYVVAIDPLDGSGNVPDNEYGSIIGIWKRDFLVPGQPLLTGRDAAAVAYTTYSSNRTFVFTTKEMGGPESGRSGVSKFRYYATGDERGEFKLLAEDLRLPPKPKYYGVGGKRRNFFPEYAAFLSALEDEFNATLRYGGSFVCDTNRILDHGGYYGYGASRKDPEGKLRLLYELIPIATIIEKAGGATSDGRGHSILDIPITNPDMRLPAHLGNREVIERLPLEDGHA